MKNIQNNISSNEQRPRLLIPKIDVVFHSLFRAHNEQLTSNFVSSLIKQKVKVINMDKDRHLIKKYPEEKLGILDLRTELEGGILCNIEIQLSNKDNIVDRILYYWSRAFSEQLIEGDDYGELHKTIAILITDFELKEMKEIKELGLKWKIMLDSNERRILTDKFELVILEIPKAKKILEKNKNDEIAQWLMFLDNPNSMEVSEIMSENEEIKEAVEELEEMSLDEELRRVAELKLKYIRDEKSTISYYKREGLEEGKKEGLELGRQEGLKEGLKEGLEQSKKMITNMLKNGMSKEQISSVAGISIQEIDDLLTSN